MRRWIFTVGLLVVGTSIASAQPPGGPGEPGRGGPPGGGGARISPMMEALDGDHDGVISAREIKNAAAALLTLDKNKDGSLTDDEFRPQGGRPTGGGPGEGGPGRGPGEGGPGRGPGEGGPGRGPGEGGPGRGPGEGGPGRGPGEGGPGEGGPRPGGSTLALGGQGMSISPDRMLTHAMEFDADKDQKLDTKELEKFIAAFTQRHGNQVGGGAGGGRPGGAGGPPGGGRPGGEGGGPPGGGRPGSEGGGPPGGAGDRPERPRRPE